MKYKIDTSFNFQQEVGTLDPDRYSLTLQEYHRILWSKPLPSGKLFELSKISGNRLYHNSELGEFYFSSDRVIPTFSRWKRMTSLIAQVPIDQIEGFRNLAETIGGIVIWPSDRINGLPTINAERGLNRKICDRIDLTIECIRRYYLAIDSPLSEVFNRYSSFFGLFQNFRGYIDYFLFQDAVTDDYTSVRIAPPFQDFMTQPIPTSVEEYNQYLHHAMNLIEARNRRIEKYTGA